MVSGEFYFIKPPTIEQLQRLDEIFKQKWNTPEFVCPRLCGRLELREIVFCSDLALNDDFTGIRWCNEDASFMRSTINFVIKEMRKTWPDFGLEYRLALRRELE